LILANLSGNTGYSGSLLVLMVFGEVWF